MLWATGAAVAGAAVIGGASAGEHLIREEAVLTDEAHGLDTGASGRATFEVDLDEGVVEYELHIDRVCDPTQAHVHLGGPGEEGPSSLGCIRRTNGNHDGALSEPIGKPVSGAYSTKHSSRFSSSAAL